MKKLFMFLWVMLLAMGISVSSQAALIDMQDASGHVVYDDQSGQYWMWDLDAYTNMDYDEQISAITNMNAPSPDKYYGLDGWHMATDSEVQALWTYSLPEIYNSFNPTVVGGDDEFMYARYDELVVVDGVDNHYWNAIAHGTIDGIYEAWQGGSVPDTYADDIMGAWVTTSAVPIPGAVWLLVSGLIGLVGIKRRLNK